MSIKQRIPGRVSVFGTALAIALTFAVMAASAAQALTWQGPEQTVLSGGSSENVAGEGKINIASELLGIPVELACSASSSGSIVGGGTGTSTLGLSGCSVSKPSECELSAPWSMKANIELVNVAGNLYQKFVPSGGTFGSFTFAGAKCGLREVSASLSGSFAGRETAKSGLTVDRPLSFNQEETWPTVQLKLGKKVATLSGEVTQHLSGSQAYHGWRGLWQETHGGWEVESGYSFPSSESVAVTGGPVNFSMTILGAPISFTCAETSASSASVKPGGTESINGLKFSGCKVEEPASCYLRGNSLTLSPITGTLMQVNGKVYEQFTPVSGSFMALSFEGASCPLSGLVIEVKGSFAGLGTEFGLFREAQPLEFSKAADEATGSAMTAGKSRMYMTGTVNQLLSGSMAGQRWAAY